MYCTVLAQNLLVSHYMINQYIALITMIVEPTGTGAASMILSLDQNSGDRAQSEQAGNQSSFKQQDAGG